MHLSLYKKQLENVENIQYEIGFYGKCTYPKKLFGIKSYFITNINKGGFKMLSIELIVKKRSGECPDLFFTNLRTYCFGCLL